MDTHEPERTADTDRILRERLSNSSELALKELEYERERQVQEFDLKKQELEDQRERQKQELALKERELQDQRNRQAQEFDLKKQELEDQRERQTQELNLKKQEFELQRQQSWFSRWNTPAVAAIVAGLLGYIGTLISGCESRQQERDKYEATLAVERQKQEGTLILNMIKTEGTQDEREKRAAANLVFLADASLVKSIPEERLKNLRAKAGTTGPALSVAASVPVVQGVDFRPSGALTASMQATLQKDMLSYQAYLARLGYDPGKAKDQVIVRVEDNLFDNAYFDNSSVVVSANLARDSEYVLSEYTWYVLKQMNPEAFRTLWESQAAVTQFRGFSQGLKFYFTCSYLNEPLVGKSFYSLSRTVTPSSFQKYLFNLNQLRKFKKTDNSDEEEHKLGEIWGSGFWELRKKLGQGKADQIVMSAWKQLKPVEADLNKPSFFLKLLVQAGKSTGSDSDSQVIRQAFEERELK
jgi:hypothetical protein